MLGHYGSYEGRHSTIADASVFHRSLSPRAAAATQSTSDRQRGRALTIMSDGNGAVQRFGSACIGAAVAEATTLPVDAAKVRLQMQVTGVKAAMSNAGHGSSSASAAIAAAGGTPCKPKYNGLLQTMYRIGVEEGPASLWRGVEPALVRQCSYTGMSFVLYQPVRDVFAGDTPADQIPFYKVCYDRASPLD